MSRGLLNFFGAMAAWPCLAPVAVAREPLSTPSTDAPGFTAAHCIANLSLFLIWITGGIFLLAGAFLATELFRFLARKSHPLSRPAQDRFVWTAIPVLALVLFLA